MSTDMHKGYPFAVRGCQCDHCIQNRKGWQAHYAERDKEIDEYYEATGRNLYMDRLSGGTT